jgi:phosphoribosylaminoimidazole (AIR) synthetase
VFAEIQRLGSVAEDEMDRVFNRGLGMALVIDAGSVNDALRGLEQAGHPASVIGAVVAGGAGIRFR